MLDLMSFYRIKQNESLVVNFKAIELYNNIGIIKLI